jgi:hypothetical protein
LSASSEETVVEPEDENGHPVQSLLGKASSSHKPGRRAVVVFPASSPPRSRSNLLFTTSSRHNESAVDDDEEEAEEEQEQDDNNDDTGLEREQQETERRQQRRLAIPHSIFRRLSTTSQMSLPRSNYDPRRVCLNPFPELTLGKHKRTIGVYVAGALVSRPQFHSNPYPSHSNLVSPYVSQQNSLLSPTGHSSTPPSSPHTPNRHGADPAPTNHPSMSPSWIGSPESALS